MVYLMARCEEKLQEVMGRLSSEKKHKYYVLDLSKVEQIESLIGQIISENGPQDGFVHSAGIDPSRPLKMSNYPFILSVMNTNFFSFIEQIRCLMKKGAYNTQFRIVGISSVASLSGSQAQTAYAASKGAMDAAVRSLAKELAGKGVRINTVIPGMINTTLAMRILELENICKSVQTNTEELEIDGTIARQDQIDHGERENKQNIMLSRQVLGMGTPIDVVNAIAYLLSDMSRFVTGTSLHVDGGALS